MINQVVKFSYATKKGVSVNKNMPPKSVDNQDSYISNARFGEYRHTHLFGVCDGHGTNGDFVSNFIKTALPKYLLEELQKSSLLF